MKKQAIVFLSVLMWIIALSHLIIGVALVGPQGFREMVAAAYGAEVTWSPQFSYILKPLGVFMMALGAIGVMAARRPLTNKPVIFVFVLLLAARVVQRFIHTSEITDAFAIPMSRSYFNAAGFGLLSLLLLVTMIFANKGSMIDANSLDTKS